MVVHNHQNCENTDDLEVVFLFHNFFVCEYETYPQAESIAWPR